MARKYFSINQAENVATSVGNLLKKAKRLKHRIDNYGGVQHRIATDGSDAGEDVMLDSEFHALMEQFYNVVEKIEDNGCRLRSVDQGVLDFYTKFEGRDVCISWHAGDEKIQYWHEIHEDDERRIVKF